MDHTPGGIDQPLLGGEVEADESGQWRSGWPLPGGTSGRFPRSARDPYPLLPLLPGEPAREGSLRAPKDRGSPPSSHSGQADAEVSLALGYRWGPG